LSALPYSSTSKWHTRNDTSATDDEDPSKSLLLFMATGTTITALKSAKRYINTSPSQNLNSVQAVLV
jgi:hypothetical protein